MLNKFFIEKTSDSMKSYSCNEGQKKGLREAGNEVKDWKIARKICMFNFFL